MGGSRDTTDTTCCVKSGVDVAKDDSAIIEAKSNNIDKIVNILTTVTFTDFPTIYFGGYFKFSDLQKLDTTITEADILNNVNFITKTSTRGVLYLKPIKKLLVSSDIQKLFNKTKNMKKFVPIVRDGIFLEKDAYLFFGTKENTYKYAIEQHKHIRKMKSKYICFTRDRYSFRDNIDIILVFSTELLLKTGLPLWTYGGMCVFTDGHEEDGSMNLYGYPENVSNNKSYLVDIMYNYTQRQV